MLIQPLKYFGKDARHFQIVYLSAFMIYGLLELGWRGEWLSYSIVILSCLAIQAAFLIWKGQSLTGLKSAMISALSLCLMFKANLWYTIICAAFLTIASKFFLRYKGKHIFNPTNFGILCTIWLTQDAWVSPGQWGSNAIFIFYIGVMSSIVLFKVGRMDTSFAFLLTFGALSFGWDVLYLGWQMDVWWHQFSSGTLLLFTFFMITDPKTTPSHRWGRVIWASVIALLSFILAKYMFVYIAPLIALFVLSPFTILFNKIWVGNKFEWVTK